MDQPPINQNQQVPVHSHKSPEDYFVLGYSLFAVIVGVIGTFILTFTTFNISTTQEAYANALVLVITLSLFTSLAAVAYWANETGVVSLGASLALAAVTYSNIRGYVSSNGFALYAADGRLLELFTLTLMLGSPLLLLSSREILKRGSILKRISLALIIAILTAFVLFFVLPNQMKFENQRHQERLRLQAGSAELEKESKVWAEEKRKEQETITRLRTAVISVAATVGDAITSSEPFPASVTPPEGYEIAEYAIVGRSLNICLKDKSSKWFMAFDIHQSNAVFDSKTMEGILAARRDEADVKCDFEYKKLTRSWKLDDPQWLANSE